MDILCKDSVYFRCIHNLCAKLIFEGPSEENRGGRFHSMSHLDILSGVKITVSCCHGDHSQALWVSFQVMETSLAQTRCECVLNAKQAVSVSSHQTERSAATVVGRHPRTDRANQSRPPDVLETARE